ncbi:MAG: hypothetical protein A2Y13_04480 [Planctomycetes bacterium GWC2_45_44]|nr:MAG: hypothetical protein A2Y13_04480 [Planctomycetes bacterium GWC2_45_44]HBR19418.1 sodium:solute symporter [Phycisphaerales bacterium]
MHWIDWMIVILFILLMMAGALYTRKYTRSVADFLAANRSAGRYLLAVAGGMASIGAISILGYFEMYYQGGFSIAWWGLMALPTNIIIALSGWIVYRFRQTRAMTMAQFFEMRYSRRFRIFAGSLCFLSGILNYGIFPAVEARFFIYFCGWPSAINILGLNISTFPLVMATILSISLFLIFMGGQISVIISNFIQGVFTFVVFIVIIVVMFRIFNWAQISEAVQIAPVGASLINPFHTDKVKDFNFWFFAILVTGQFYNFMGWQGEQGYYCSAKSAHEAQMAQILGKLRTMATLLMFIIVPICMYAVMHSAGFASQAERINNTLAGMDNAYIRSQLLVPVAVKMFLPVGIVGAIFAMMLAAAFSAHESYLHSWGSILIQDIVMVLRKKPLSQESHIKLLRVSIGGVAVFAFIFGLVFPLKDYIFMWFAITGAIYLGGSGAVIMGGLYWKRGTTAAAWTAMIAGAILSVGGIIIRQIDPEFPLNGQKMYGIGMLCCIILYIGVSLLNRKPSFNMDKMLHRGKYAVESNSADGIINGKSIKLWVLKRLGITEEFNRRDKLIYFGSLLWTVLWFGGFIVGTVYNLTNEVSDRTWLKFWYVYLVITFVTLVAFTVWYSVGGIVNIKDLFRRLDVMKRDAHDDGMVREQVKNPEQPVETFIKLTEKQEKEKE